MEDLSQRQIDILRAIIKEYTENGEAVGSEILEKKYKLGVSPATIRNEMVVLAQKGYLAKAHFSSGRIPSAQAFRFYIKHLMKEREISTVDEVAYKNSIWDERDEEHRLLAHAVRVLSQRTSLLSIITTSRGDIYYAGVGNLLGKIDGENMDASKQVFNMLDQVKFWESVLKQFYVTEEDIMCMLGEEDFHNASFEMCASVFGEFEGQNVKGIMGVVGPKRMSYEDVIPQVRYFSHLLGEIIRDQR